MLIFLASGAAPAKLTMPLIVAVAGLASFAQNLVVDGFVTLPTLPSIELPSVELPF